jgi:hypothetical protein
MGDGPKWICDPHRIKGVKDCLIYSFGSNNEFDFEESVYSQVRAMERKKVRHY